MSNNELAKLDECTNVCKNHKKWLRKKINKLRAQIMDAENSVVRKINNQ